MYPQKKLFAKLREKNFKKRLVNIIRYLYQGL